MSRKKSLSKHLSRRDVDGEEFLASVLEIYNGSDRVAAIMGGALIEDALMTVIKAALADPFDVNALFHDQGSPFGTLRARIVAGKALGIYDAVIAKDLEIIRDVRNQFAHALLVVDFKNEHIHRACMELSIYRNHSEHSTREHISEGRHKFEDACWDLQSRFNRKANDLLGEKIDRLKRGNVVNELVAASLQGRPNDVLGNIDPD